jgi:hypothetical protein
LTILEMTIVIGAMMVLTLMMFFAVRAWRMGTDRSTCIMSQRNVQLALRSYQNMYGYGEGTSPRVHGGSQNIIEHLYLHEFIGQNYYQLLNGERNCPGNGEYLVDSPTVFPPEGVLFMRCSLAETRKHGPQGSGNW